MENIDVSNQQYLVQALEGSVSLDDNHRKKCEEYLIKFSVKEGSVAALMRVMSNFQLDASVRLAASIRLKNHIVSHWINTENLGGAEVGDLGNELARPNADSTLVNGSGDGVIPKSDRTFLLDNLYLCLVTVKEKTIRNQCYEMLRHVMFNVEIGQVKNLLTAVSSDLVQRSDSDRVLCALYALRKVMSKYEYHGSSHVNEVNEIISAYFGPLISVAQDASKIGLSNNEAANLIHLVLKIYFSSALLTSPTIQLLRDSMGMWMNLISYVLNDFIAWQQSGDLLKLQITAFSELNNENEEYVCKLEQFKCLKWSLRILNRFMSRQNSFTDDENKHKFYSSYLSNNYSNDNLVLLLKLLKLESESKLVLNNLTHHLIWTYLRHSLSVEAHFHFLLKPNLKEIIGVYCLRTFKYTKEDLENYEEDPENFIQTLSDVCFQFYSNRGSCSDFLKELVKSFSQESITQIKEVVAAGFESGDETVLYSALSIVGYVSEKLVKKQSSHSQGSARETRLDEIVNKRKKNRPSCENLQIDGEELLERKVLALLESQNTWLRMRSAWLGGCLIRRVGTFRSIALLNKIYFKLMDLLVDPELVVAVLTANAIIELFRVENEGLQASIVGSISLLLERLFLLMNRIELESVTSVLGEIVDSYSHEVLPYAKDIILNVSNHLMRNLGMPSNSDSSKDFDEDERVLVRWSMLQTLNTVVRLLAPSSTPQTGDPNSMKAAQKDEMKEKIDLQNYVTIISTVNGLLKMLFRGDDEGCVEYLDEAAILLANLVRLLDVGPVTNLLLSSGFGFSDFWLLFTDLLNLMRKEGFELVTDFSLVRDPLVALAKRDPKGFASMLNDFYKLCMEGRNSGFGDQVDEVLGDCVEVSLESGAVSSHYVTLVDDTAARVAALVSGVKGSSMHELASDNMQLMRLANLLLLYYYQNLLTTLLDPSVLNHLKILTEFVVKYSLYCNWKSSRKYCILTCCTLVKNNVTKVGSTSVVNLLVTLLQNSKDDHSDSEEYSYSESDSDDYEDDDDDDYTDDDSEWSEFEFEDSPLKAVCEMKLAKQVLMDVKEPLESHQLNRQQVMSFLKTL